MFWRLTNQEILANTADDNRVALRAVVGSGEPAGLVLYSDGEPVGWCSVSPRPGFRRLAHTNGLQPDDPLDTSVWSVVCIFIKQGHRRNGAAGKLLDASIEFAREHGASVVEGYPLADAQQGRRSGLSSGTIALFTHAGFTLQERPASGRRVVMQRAV
jgi:GNAT superfamily N-acetyltransferase